VEGITVVYIGTVYRAPPLDPMSVETKRAAEEPDFKGEG